MMKADRILPGGHLPWLALPLALVALAGTAVAGDGVIEINAARAEAGGVTPGDSPGYPVTLDQSGSYRLTGSLFVSGTNIDVVEITASHVTLDLNGFEIRCLYLFTPCARNGTGRGIDAETAEDVTLRNGVVRDMASDGIRVGARARLEDLRVLDNGGNGVFMLDGLLTGSLVDDNASSGIKVYGEGTVIEGNSVRRNGDSGIYLGSHGAVVMRNAIMGNTGYGINHDTSDVVLRTFAYGHNTLLFNSLGPIPTTSAVQGVAVQTAGNACSVNSPGTCP
jgi:hypothetical protein